MSKKKQDDEDRQCSFCWQREDAVRTLHAGPPPDFVCNECIDLCNGIFAENAPGVNPDLVCSFCGMNQRHRLVAGPTVYICDECVRRFSADTSA
jgi:ATP-dependent protease Clp ATPase subunit